MRKQVCDSKLTSRCFEEYLEDYYSAGVEHSLTDSQKVGNKQSALELDEQGIAQMASASIRIFLLFKELFIEIHKKNGKISYEHCFLSSIQ